MSEGVACRKAFADALLGLARDNRDIVVLTSDSSGSAALNGFFAALPAQHIETGIAEQNEVGIASGLAAWGKKVFVCAPACFLSARSLEQVKVDVAYSRADVKIIGISGGVSYGALGMTHFSLHDIATMRALPNIGVVLPSDRFQTAKLAEALVHSPGPVYVRMGRGPVEDVYRRDDCPFEIGKANTVHEGDRLTLVAAGEMVHPALVAARELADGGIHVRVIDMHTIRPLDEEAVIRAAKETGGIITIEEHGRHGGLGGAVSEVVAERCPVPMRILGLPTDSIFPGEREDVFAHYHLTPDGIIPTVKEFLKAHRGSVTPSKGCFKPRFEP